MGFHGNMNFDRSVLCNRTTVIDKLLGRMGDELLSESKALETRLEERLRLLESRLEDIQWLKTKNVDRRRIGRRNRARSTETASNRRNIYRLLPNRTDQQSDQQLLNIEENEFNSESRGENPIRIVDAEPVSRQDWLLSRLRTNRYFWDTPQPLRGRRKIAVNSHDDIDPAVIDRSRFLPLNDPISAVSGILLESDMPAMNERLDDIRQTLNDLKNFSLDAPSADYHRFTSKKLQKQTVATYESDRSTESFTDIRSRILNMEFHIERRIREIATRRDIDIQLPIRDDQPVIRVQPDRLMADENKVKNNTTLHLPSNPQKQMNNDLKEDPHLENIPQRRLIVTDASQPHFSNIADNEKLGGKKEHLAANVPHRSAATNHSEIDQTSNVQVVEDSPLPSTSNPKILQPRTSDAKSTHYDRMLELLRRPQFNVSSSSSSEDEIASVRPPANIIGQKSSVTRPTQPPPPPVAVSVNAVTVPSRAQPSEAPPAIKANASDSESDFFK